MLVRLRDETFRRPRSRRAAARRHDQRDQTAVERIGSGLIKLLYPDGKMTDDELLEVVTFACELRQRVHQQLCADWPRASSSRG